MFSDSMLHFLEIGEKFAKSMHPNYIMALNLQVISIQLNFRFNFFSDILYTLQHYIFVRICIHDLEAIWNAFGVFYTNGT